jgi:hypothetical protein
MCFKVTRPAIFSLFAAPFSIPTARWLQEVGNSEFSNLDFKCPVRLHKNLKRWRNAFLQFFVFLLNSLQNWLIALLT